jgi:hypothetical protein
MVHVPQTVQESKDSERERTRSSGFAKPLNVLAEGTFNIMCLPRKLSAAWRCELGGALAGLGLAENGLPFAFKRGGDTHHGVLGRPLCPQRSMSLAVLGALIGKGCMGFGGQGLQRRLFALSALAPPLENLAHNS